MSSFKQPCKNIRFFENTNDSRQGAYWLALLAYISYGPPPPYECDSLTQVYILNLCTFKVSPSGRFENSVGQTENGPKLLRDHFLGFSVKQNLKKIESKHFQIVPPPLTLAKTVPKSYLTDISGIFQSYVSQMSDQLF